MPTSGVTSFLSAALSVLDESRRPMTTDEITAEAIRRGLLAPGGRTPTATMRARLYLETIANPGGRLVRISEPGGTRALRNSVRWALRE